MKLRHSHSFFPSATIGGVSRWFRSYGFAEVFDDLVVGAYPLDEDDVAALARDGIRRVLNLTEDAEYRPGDRRAVEQALSAAGIEERRLRLPDYGGLPPEALDAAAREINAWLDDGARTYLHCRAGWQRSAAVAAGVVALRTGCDIDDALDSVRRRKPSADPLPHQREDVRRWWAARRDGSAPHPGPPEGIA
jgi:protein-tyrosine phosphatase